MCLLLHLPFPSLCRIERKTFQALFRWYFVTLPNIVFTHHHSTDLETCLWILALANRMLESLGIIEIVFLSCQLKFKQKFAAEKMSIASKNLPLGPRRCLGHCFLPLDLQTLRTSRSSDSWRFASLQPTQGSCQGWMRNSGFEYPWHAFQNCLERAVGSL